MELKNDHNVYILGAGFSCDAGLPMINGFLTCMRDSHEWLVERGRKAEAEAVAKVLKFRLDAASAAYWTDLDLENIEELFSLASASPGATADHIRLAIAATLDYARSKKGGLQTRLQIRGSKKFAVRAKRYPSWLKASDSDNQAVQHDEGMYTVGLYAFYIARLLGMFDEVKPKGENSFITFNYDTLVEDGLRELSLPYSYGPTLECPPTSEPLKGLPANEAIQVLKLHGSVNWVRPAEAKSLRVCQGYTDVLSEKLVPELIPPTWKKVFENQLESVWEQAIQKLNNATRIVIIGFSMPPTDMHFKYLLAAGLKSNISLREIVFVNPDPKNELEPRARKLLREAYIDSGRIRFIKSDLSSFVGSHPSDIEKLGRPREYGMSFNLFNPYP